MTTLRVQRRNMETKAKKLRREGYVTGNLFGKEIEGSVPLKMNKMEVERLLKTDHKGSQIMLFCIFKTFFHLFLQEREFFQIIDISKYHLFYLLF